MHDVRIINVIINKVLNTSYNIYLGDCLLDNISEYIDFPKNTLIVTDDNIPNVYIKKILDSASKKNKNCYVHSIKPGEDSKSLYTYEEIMNSLIEKKFSRSDLIIALGGGVVGDLAGFVASTYKRGIDFINIPTTTLSMVDSSIGGKVAVNVNGIKNIVGAFYMPKKVIISFDTLETLPVRQFNNGLFEALKSGLIGDKDLYELFKKNVITNNDKKLLKSVVEKSINVKKKVVEEDPYEKGLRKILNFGHTIGHGIESENFNNVFHGEAVALGMMYFLNNDVKQEYQEILEKYNIPNNYKFNKENIVSLITNDKKIIDGGIEVVYVNNIGEAEIKKLTLEEIKKVICGE